MAESVEHPPITGEIESSSSIAAKDIFDSVKVSLADLCAKGTAQYAHKNYEEAADLYARASELQAELNGEMSPDNAEILFLYGRSLFKVGQSKSDVLGGKAGGEKKKPNAATKTKKTEDIEEKTVDEKITEEGMSIVAEQNRGNEKEEEAPGAKKPLFQFTGDENFEDSDEEEEGGPDGEEEEEEDDLAVAFEVLDLARVLFTKKLEVPEEGVDDKGKSVGDSAMTKHIKDRLADTHDLLAEISLENERFPNAVTDFRAALQHKQELYPAESEIIAEAHFKLSLALEFASISRPKDEDEGEDDAPATEADSYLDQALRDEAVKELEAAIHSTRLKLQIKEVELASSHSPDDNDITRSQIAEVKDIVTDMENRLVELKGPALNVKEALYGPEIMGGVLGAALGESPSEATARIEEAKKGANDLTGLIKRKKPTESTTNGTNGKRKAEDDGTATNGDAKKVKFEEPTDDSAKHASVEDASEE